MSDINETEEINEAAEPDMTSPMAKGYIRSFAERLYKGRFVRSCTYGTFFLLDSFMRQGNRVYVVALDKRMKPLDIWRASFRILLDEDDTCEKIDEFAENCGAKYVILAKKGRVNEYPRELYYANRIYEGLKKVTLYDYVTIEDDTYFSYMEHLR